MPCVEVSGRQRQNLDHLIQKVIDTAKTKVNLLEDYGSHAQCVVVDANLNEASHYITCTLIVRRGLSNLTTILCVESMRAECVSF